MTIMLFYLKLLILFIDFTNVYCLTLALYWTLLVSGFTKIPRSRGSYFRGSGGHERYMNN